MLYKDGRSIFRREAPVSLSWFAPARAHARDCGSALPRSLHRERAKRFSMITLAIPIRIFSNLKYELRACNHKGIFLQNTRQTPESRFRTCGPRRLFTPARRGPVAPGAGPGLAAGGRPVDAIPRTATRLVQRYAQGRIRVLHLTITETYQ